MLIQKLRPKLHQPFGKKLASNQGFTLVEVIVTLCIFAILMGVTVAMFVSVTNSYTKTTEMNTNKLLGDSIYGYVSRRIAYANDVQIDPANSKVSSGYTNKLEVIDGQLYLNGKNEFSPVFYDKSHIRLNLTVLNRTDVQIEVEVFDSENELCYQTATSVRCLNLSVNNNTIHCNHAGKMVNPVISYNITY